MFWNLSDEAVIPAANPNIEPIIGPPGSKNEGSNPTPCANPIPIPDAPRNVANLGFAFSPSIERYTLPNAPSINDFFFLSLKSLPYRNSWNASFFATILPPIPSNAPVIGPPGRKKEDMNPIPAPLASDFLLSLNLSCSSLDITPPERLPSSPKSPKAHFLNVSD